MLSNQRTFKWKKLYASDRKKVTLGFKCDPSIKIKLAQEASSLGLTLSSYTERLISSIVELRAENSHLKIEVQRLTIMNGVLKSSLDFYEGGIIESLFMKYRDQEVKFVNHHGDSETIKIERARDVFTIMTSSFKESNND